MPNPSKGLRREMAALIRAVWRANHQLKESGLVTLTWGNVSGLDRSRGIVVIKPSGVEYAALRPEAMVLTDLAGRPIESALRPSTDLPTHIELYRAFPEIGGVAHTHSVFATAFAQAGKRLPCLGTTHADYCHGAVPVTEPMRPRAIKGDYEIETGRMIVRKMRQLHQDPRSCPFIFVAQHAPFSWGATAAAAVENAIVLETICKMALLSWHVGGPRQGIARALLDKHYFRKHGRDAYYGQVR